MTWTSPLWRRIRTRGSLPIESLLTRGFVAIDLETTGLDTTRDRVVSLAAIPFVGAEAGEGYTTLVNPGRPIPPASTRIHGITDSMVARAPTIERVLDDVERVCGTHLLVGHGLAFDLAILGRERQAFRRPPLRNLRVDTMSLAAALHPEWPTFELDDVAARTGVPVVDRHTAPGDAVAAGRLLLAFLAEARTRGCRTLPELVWLQETGRARIH